MTNRRPSLPAYIRLPDGLRFAGTADLRDSGVLCFRPKQAISPLPPEGLAIDLLIAGLPNDEDKHLDIPGLIESLTAREILITPDNDLPLDVIEALDPDAVVHLASSAEARRLLQEIREEGVQQLVRGMRRFMVALGDHLFDLSTSSRYAVSGEHAHYDALNALKRDSDSFVNNFETALKASASKTEKEEGQSFADLEAASASTLGLIGLDEMDQKLAIDKIVRRLIEKHRVALESLTIRTALVADIEPRKARTPFHPLYLVKAFVACIEQYSDSSVVVLDTLRFFGEQYTPLLEQLYPDLNAILIAAGIEPDLEADIRDNGSLLNPVEKRVIKSTVRTRSSADDTAPDAPEPVDRPAPVPTAADSKAATGAEVPGGVSQNAPPPEAGPSEQTAAPGESSLGAGRDGQQQTLGSDGPQDRHDAMYDAVINALNLSRPAPSAPARAGESANRSPGDSDLRGRASQDLAATAVQPGVSGDAAATGNRGPIGRPGGLLEQADAATAAVGRQGMAGEGLSSGAGGGETASAPQHILDDKELLTALHQLQGASQPEVNRLSELPPLESLVRNLDGEGNDVGIGSDGANRLQFVDNVFRTLDKNFDVSNAMAPSLARLRVPLARLSLQEPRFFTQPGHPAQQVLDKLSVLASSDNNISRSLQKKVAEIVDRIAENYESDSDVFASAEGELNGLMSQHDRVLKRNIERVVSGLEGQERLNRAQQRVEHLLEQHLDRDNTPEALLELLDSGWRSALVQLALREGDDSPAWTEETTLLATLLDDFRQTSGGELAPERLEEASERLHALNQRIQTSNPGSVSHEAALNNIRAVLSGQAPLATAPYAPAVAPRPVVTEKRVENLPRLRRWIKRVKELEPGAKLRYRDKKGERQRMKLAWVSDDRERFAFVNDRGQKIADFSAVQLARHLSRGARPPTKVDSMSVLNQSMYETLEEAQKTLSFDRNRDSLTQLINGDSLLYQVERTLRHAQKHGSEHAFMLLDIDNFGLVNKVFDETSGDEVLLEFARLLGQLNDRRSLTARMQEDEFGILMTYRGTDDAKRLAEKIRSDIAGTSLSINGEPVSFTVSIGIAPILEASADTQAVLAQARQALDQAKSQGRDQIVVFDVDQQEVLAYKRDRDASRERLEEAMSTDTLVLRAQPIVKSAVSGQEGTSHHYEILLSLRGDDDELQSPQDFIMSAERFGYVTLVDRWVLRQAFIWISSLMDQQKVVPELSINLSGTSITDYDFLDYVLEQISEYGVGTSKLCFEITETGAIDNLPTAADFVRTLKNIGCKFSLDDFGTGLASHKYLKELPVDYVKIDGTFITNIHNDKTDYAMTKSINDLAHFLGQKTVAECVEHLEIVPALREIGIDYLQGWGIGMPRELQEITDELDNVET
jgi:diguanylate cyclase (GGDEF)-like protein